MLRMNSNGKTQTAVTFFQNAEILQVGTGRIFPISRLIRAEAFPGIFQVSVLGGAPPDRVTLFVYASRTA
jgi:hypothetical protein